MQKYFDSIIGNNGDAVPNASVTVLLFGTSTPASLFSNAAGTAGIANPVTTDASGYFEFYAADGRYSLSITASGFGTKTVTDILLDDPTNANAVVVSGGTVDNTPIGATTPAAGSFTTLSTTGAATLASASVAGAATVGNGLAVTGNLSATGNVTVGDASTDTLIVQAGSAALPSIIPTGDTNTGVWFPAADTVAVSTGGSERLRVDSSGNLLLNSSAVTGKITVGGTSGSATIGLLETGVRSWAIRSGGVATNVFDIADLTAAASRLQIDASGNLGLGVPPTTYVGATGSNGRSIQGDSFIIGSGSGTDHTSYLTNATRNAYDSTFLYRVTATAQRYDQNPAGHRFFSAPSGTAGNAITFTQSLAVGLGTTLALQGASSVTGCGVSFPATQAPSTDPNTLDDYEEGTWTPNQGVGLTVVGAFSSSGAYTKIGRQVTVQGSISGATSVAVGAGATICSNLPFAVASTNVGSMANSIFTQSGVAGAVGGGTSVAAGSAITASASIIFTITYFV